MRVVALRAGYFNKPMVITRTLVRRKGNTKEKYQVETSAVHILPGDEFDWDGELANWMEPVAVEEEEAAEGEMSRKEIIAKLRASGIEYFKGAPTEKLKELLPKE